MLRIAGLGSEARWGEWVTDAAEWTVTKAGARPTMLAAQSVRSISRSGRVLFRSDQPASFAMLAIEETATGFRVAVVNYNAGETNVVLKPGKPERCSSGSIW